MRLQIAEEEGLEIMMMVAAEGMGWNYIKKYNNYRYN